MAPMFGMFILRELTEDQIVQLAQAAAAVGVDVPAVVVPAPPPPPPVDTGAAAAWNTFGAPGYLVTLIEQYFPRKAWEHAAAIARCESGFNPNAHNTNGEDSRGLYQINVVPAANPDLLALGNLFDARVNVQAARIVWERQGWQAWYHCAIAAGIGPTGPGVP